jgi:hypothetical protein
MRSDLGMPMNTIQCVARMVLVAAVFVGVGVSSARSQQPVYPPTSSLEEIQRRIGECRPEHPRLLTTRKTLRELPKSVERDPLRKKLADLVVQQAVLLRDATPIERKLEGRRLLSQSRRCVQRVLTLAMAYHLTGDVRHVDRCRDEMLAAARFSDWNPAHFLDVAEMTFALAIGYDWLYDQLDPASREAIRKAIVEKGVRLQFESSQNGWVHRDNNWGQVCHGGLTIGALAVLEDEPELAAKTVHSALHNVVNAMDAYAPLGSYPEGPSYWDYGTSYNVLLIGALESVLGRDFGLSKAPGFDETGAYPALMCGPSGLFFNYADGHSERRPEPLRFWFAARYHRDDWLRGERELWKQVLSQSNQASQIELGRLLPLALLWMDDSAVESNIRMPLSWYGAGNVPISIHRSSWTDPRATFIGLKGGSPSSNHGHMDIGSFVLDSDGVRWASDLGSEGYYGIESRKMGLWGRAQNSDRWTIFRLNNLGHNTLVIDGQLQVAAGNAKIVEFSDDSVRPYSIVDMTPVYRKQVQSARRGVVMLPTREVLIQDELTGLRPGSRVRWGMITPAETDGLGKDALTLHQAGEKLRLSLVAAKSDGWKQIDTAKPRHDWDSPNPGTRMVAFEATAPESGELTLVVAATPGSCSDAVASKLPIVPLDDWGRRP